MLELFLALFLMLAVSWVFGEALQRVGLPALVGQILAGVLIGPSLLNVVQPTTDLATIESLSLFFIMFLTGLSVRPEKIAAAGRKGAIVSTVAFAIPFIAGTLAANDFGIGAVSSLTVGLTISITAVPVNAIVLMELGLLDTELGAAVIAAGVLDDIVSFVALSFIQQYAGGKAAVSYLSIATDAVTVILFIAALFICVFYLQRNMTAVRKRMDGMTQHMRSPGSYIAVLVIIAIGVSLLAEWAGLQLTIGAFFAGILASELTSDERLESASDVVRGSTFGFFSPLAFAYIGTELLLSSIGGIVLLAGALLCVAVASKLLGGFIGARIARFTSSDSLVIGLLMNSRGFVELVIASTAYQIGLIDQGLFSMVVTIGIITTIISPIATRIAAGRRKGVADSSVAQ